MTDPITPAVPVRRIAHALPCALPYAAPLAAWAFLLRVPLAGHPPVSQDHTVHLFGAWLVAEHLLPHGAVTGWSDFWFAGDPTGHLYPVGAYVFVALVRAATGGLASLEASYAFAFAAAWLLATAGLFAFVRRLAGPWAAMVAALLFLVDPGHFRQGGWEHFTYWGVWPQLLALGPLLFGCERLWCACASGGAHRVAAAALLVGVAAVVHPVTLTFAALVAPAFALVHRAWRHVALVALLAALVGAWWYVPYAARAGEALRYTALWGDLATLWGGLFTGRLYRGMWVVPHVLGLAGIACALARRDRAGLALVLALALVLTCGSTTLLDHLRFVDAAGALGAVQFARFVVIAKLLLFALGGYAVATAAVHATRMRFAGVVLPVVAAAVTFGALASAPTLRAVGRIETAGDTALWRGYRAFLDWSRAEAARDGRFFRIAYLDERNRHFFMAAPVWNGLPAFKVGFTPAALFRHKFSTDDPAVWRALSVRYAVSRSPGVRPRGEAHLVQRFGPVHVWEMPDWTPARWSVAGAGTVAPLRFDAGDIALRVTGAGAGTELTVHVAPHPLWRATLDGQPAPLRSVPFHGSQELHEIPYFMQIALPPGDHTLTLRFALAPLDLAARVTSALAVVALLVVALARRRPAPPAAAPPRRLVTALEIAIPASLALALATLSIAGHARDAASRTLRGRLAGAQVSAGARSCAREGSHFVCGGPPWQPVGEALVPIDGRLRRCIQASPHSAGPLTLHFPDVVLGTAIAGHMGHHDERADNSTIGQVVHLDVVVATGVGPVARRFTAPARRGYAPFELPTPGLAGVRAGVRFTITAPDPSGRHFCFDAAVVTASR